MAQQPPVLTQSPVVSQPAAGPVYAEPTSKDEVDKTKVARDERGTFNLQLENDLFGSRQDRHYTTGTRFTWFSPEDTVPWGLRDVGSILPTAGPNSRMRWSAGLGQNIYTPKDISQRNPDPTERPYAGWLYGSVGLVADSGSELDNIELQVGVVGPSSLAEQTQKAVHDFLPGQVKPAGWDTQLKDEPGIVLLYEHKWRALAQFETRGLGIDITPHVNAALGNVYTYAGAGAEMRFGDNLPNDYGPARIAPSIPGTAYFTPQDEFGWYLFVGAEGRAVAHNIFLDGNTFRDSRSVDRNVFVAELQAGFAVTVNNFRFAFTQVLRTREFEGQDTPDKFGTFSISYRY